MTNLGWMVLENIVILMTVCFLCWYFDTGWWALLILVLNKWHAKDVLKEENAVGSDQK
jgi:hypothetical protein